MFVNQRMTTKPFTINADQTIPQALQLMNKHKLRHIPVVHQEKVVGILTRNDIATASPSKATTLSTAEATYLLSKLKIKKIMSTNPIVIRPDSLLEEAAVLMRNNKIELLPVVENKHLIGVITESDLLDSFIDILGFKDHGTRLTIEATDTPGVLAKITTITAHYDTNITHLAVYRGQLNKSIIVLGLNTLNTSSIEKELTKSGFNILAKLENL